MSGYCDYLKVPNMTNNPEISIAEEYSAYPAGRDDTDGKFNGKRFKDKILVPKLRDAIEKGQKLIVSLDGLESCGSSFLDSAFGGMIRHGDFEKKKLSEVLMIAHKQPWQARYKNAIIEYIRRAKLIENN